jgi:hypothetical protein
MKFREQTAKKKSIRQIAGMFLAVTVLLAGSPYIAEAAEIVKDMDGTAYAQDAAGFVYQIPKGATTKKGCSIYMYTGEKSTVTFPTSKIIFLIMSFLLLHPVFLLPILS